MKSLLHATIVCLGVLFGGSSARADGTPLIKSYVGADKEAATFNAKELKRLADARSSRGARSVSVISIDRNAFLGNILTIATPSGEVLRFTKLREEYVDSIKARPPNPKDMNYMWTGQSANGGFATFSVTADGAFIAGSVTDDQGKRFNISSVNAKNQYLVEIDSAAAELMVDDTPKGTRK